MLRNQQKSIQLFKNLMPLTKHQRFIQLNTVGCDKSTNVIRQGKILGKLFGQRLSGSKKRWFPSTTDSMQANVVSQFGKSPKEGGKNATRRVKVLNKLFMEHITDLMATGEISESILGKGLQISRVKISQDFAYINVFWSANGEADKDAVLEHELHRCSGLLRHSLSQLGLMGVVPRIKFVKEKLLTNMNQVETLLRDMDFGSDEEEIDIQHRAVNLKQEFFGRKTNDISVIKQDLEENGESLKANNFNVPEMRHDVLGLDHKGIMLKILIKMRKSKQAWENHLQNTSPESDNSNSTTIHSASFNQLARINEKLAKAADNSEKFEAFLAKRKEKRNTPERKKFRASDHYIDDVNVDHHDYTEFIMSKHQLFDADDYLLDETEDKQYK